MDFANDDNKNEVELAKRPQTNIRRSCLSWTFCWPIFRNCTKMEKIKNPMLLDPVIRCVLKFLNIHDIKNCRFLCREWGSTGKLVLASRAQIYFHKPLLPADFRSCFLDFSSLFSAFKISGSLIHSWTIEEFTKFFKEQKHLQELTLDLKYGSTDIVESINRPVLHKITRYENPLLWRNLTKLTIEGDWPIPKPLVILPMHLMAHIEYLNLSLCRINLEEGVLIYPVRLKLGNITFFQDGIQLSRVRINDFVDFRKAKNVSLDCSNFATEDITKYVVDLLGNVTLERLILKNCEIVNGETSQWAIEQVSTVGIPYSLNNQIKIKEFYLCNAGTLDLSTLPNTIQNLAINGMGDYTTVICRKPIFLQNLQYLYILESPGCDTDFFYLSYFMNCPQLTHLKLHLQNEKEMNSLWMPKSVKTLTLENAVINWIDENYLSLEKLVFQVDVLLTVDKVKTLFQAKIQVDDVAVHGEHIYMNKNLVDFLEMRNRFSFGKRLYICELDWDEVKLKNSILKKYFDAKSSFYVFENKEKGTALSREYFYEHANIPKHLDILSWHFKWWSESTTRFPS